MDVQAKAFILININTNTKYKLKKMESVKLFINGKHSRIVGSVALAISQAKTDVVYKSP